LCDEETSSYDDESEKCAAPLPRAKKKDASGKKANGHEEKNHQVHSSSGEANSSRHSDFFPFEKTTIQNLVAVPKFLTAVPEKEDQKAVI
jgi:hypothetical protein